MTHAGREIERKFLVRGDAWRAGAQATLCRQGYLLATPECTIRVRELGDSAFLAIKGRTEGITRPEFEYPIPLVDAAYLLDRLCDSSRIVAKNRFVIPHGGRDWEVDEFSGRNAGLIVAEVELASEDEVIDLPPWVGEEITHDPRYLNACLARAPYSTWDT
jgi:adenylate cyclase